MDTYEQWRILRGAVKHVKAFGYPDERSKGNIMGIGEYMTVDKTRLNSKINIKEVEFPDTGSVSNN